MLWENGAPSHTDLCSLKLILCGPAFLQVNGINLLGENHQDVVNILKELPIDVTMVCCRRTVPPIALSEMDSLDINDLELTEKVGWT
jgi:multiple PDZ domain protein